MTTSTKRSDAEIEAEARALLSQPYRREIRPDPEAGYLATAPELPGCMTDGDTPVEALENLEEAMLVWLEAAIARGRDIPKPPASAAPTSASGRLLVRMPRSLHASLLQRAEVEGVSANQLVVAAIARQLG